MMMKRIGKTLLCLAVLLLALLGASASAEVKLSFSPENPRKGDYVDLVVTPDREGYTEIRYELSTPAGVVYKYDSKKQKPSSHLKASFRPREEADYTLTVSVIYGKKDIETVSVTIPVSGVAPVQQGPDVIYSQKDGWWHNKMYSKKYHRSLEKAGCAIFTLSHALQRLGFEGESVMPDTLGEKYSYVYIEGRGTDNERLLTTAGEHFGFQTHQDLIESEAELATWFRLGNSFSFSIVIGHIAYADGLSEDGTKVHVIDSAPGATYERIKNALPYVQLEDGTFKEAASPEDIPGWRWFFETGEYGGLEYWLDISYCAKKGMRPVRSAWLSLNGSPVTDVEYSGALVSKVTTGGSEAQRINTRDLSWTTVGADGPKIALITGKKGASLLDGSGKKKDIKPLGYGSMAFVLEVTEKKLFVAWKDTFGYINRSDAELLSASEEEFMTGLVSLNGKTAGTSPVTVRKEASGKAKSIGEWKPGTPVAVVSKSGEYYLVEAKGLRGWIQSKYLTLEGAEPDGQKVDEGE